MFPHGKVRAGITEGQVIQGRSPVLTRPIEEYLGALHKWMVNTLGDLGMPESRTMKYYGYPDWSPRPGDELEWYENPALPEPAREIVD